MVLCLNLIKHFHLKNFAYASRAIVWFLFRHPTLRATQLACRPKTSGVQIFIDLTSLTSVSLGLTVYMLINNQWLLWMNHNFSRFLRSGQNLSLLIERGIIDSNNMQSKYFKITPMLSITFLTFIARNSHMRENMLNYLVSGSFSCMFLWFLLKRDQGSKN